MVCQNDKYPHLYPICYLSLPKKFYPFMPLFQYNLYSTKYYYGLLLLIVLLGGGQLALQAQNEFATAQLNHPRVAEARSREYLFRREFERRNIPFPPTEIFFRAFKKEGILEAWAKNNNGTFEKIKEYTICAPSGKLGPKRKRGDLQVPEGFYYIKSFNPVSSYYLSLEVSYPNESDRILGGGSSLGGDIYLHGDCVSEGCLPLTNDKMKEVYWMATLARDNGQAQIPIHIFPYKFRNLKFHQLEVAKHYNNQRLINFWDNLRIGYDIFENNRTLPNVNVNGDGSYSFW